MSVHPLAGRELALFKVDGPYWKYQNHCLGLIMSCDTEPDLQNEFEYVSSIIKCYTHADFPILRRNRSTGYKSGEKPKAKSILFANPFPIRVFNNISELWVIWMSIAAEVCKKDLFEFIHIISM